MVTQQKANRLINATSPYLLQHAYNPVDWFEWGREALDKAKNDDKPILVSIGYSSCHWCHVMERESFEKEEIAKIMNDYFVCIKVDREERPDVDQIYMDAVQALGINGGWPLNVFLTPDQKPFFGGTYFSPATWVQVLRNIHNAFDNHRDKIEDTAEELRLHLLKTDVNQYKQAPVNSDFQEDLQKIYHQLQKRFDKQWGGMDKAPKFVMPSIWLWLLRYYHITQDQSAIDQVLLTLKRIGMGGIYDQVGGGFSRYSVDAHWFAPHFEKMLYDNAQLISLYAEAFMVTRDQEFRTIVYETFNWLQREMTSDDGGFYAALDADSEGVEGKYYVWTKQEFNKPLHEQGPLLSSYYNITDDGNWEHGVNILTRTSDESTFLKDNHLDVSAWHELLREQKKILLRIRQERIPPGLDDKIISAWNAMMICGLTDAYKAFHDKRFLKAALLNMRFLENELMEGTTLYRSFKGKRSEVKGFLDDYAYMIQAQIKLYQVTFDEYWIHRAQVFMEYVIENFLDPQDGYFFYALEGDQPLIARKKEIFDNVIPSSNSVMALNLLHLGKLLDNEAWIQQASNMTLSLAHIIQSDPNYMSHWAIVCTELKKGLTELAIAGDQAEVLRETLHQKFFPFVLTCGMKSKSDLPLLQDKSVSEGKTMVYVCFNKTCKVPVESVIEAERQITETGG